MIIIQLKIHHQTAMTWTFWTKVLEHPLLWKRKRHFQTVATKTSITSLNSAADHQPTLTCLYLKVMMLLTISLYRACCILLKITKRLCVIVQAELLFQPLYRFTNNLPDLSQLLCVPITTDDLDTITSNVGTIFSNTLETVAPIKLKKVREKMCWAVVQQLYPFSQERNS